jgi:predicted dehydrogenase
LAGGQRVITIAVIGYGYWGPNVARCIAEVDGATLSAIGDPRPEALARAAQRYPGVRLESDPGLLIADPAIDVVVIATPVETHFGLAMAALRAGKHVLVEKPMTRTAEQGRQLVDEAERRGRVLMVDHTFIYTSAVRKIAELIAQGELGDIYYYDSIRVNLGLFRRDVNVVWDLAVHDLSILEYVMQKHPVAVSANGASHAPGTPESMAYITLFFGGGTIAHVNVNWLAPVKVRQTLIGGSRKMIVFDDLQPSEKIKVYDKGVTLTSTAEQIYQILVEYRVGDMWAPQLSSKEALRTEAEHLVACIQSGSRPITDGAMGLRVVEMLEAASRSIRERGHPVDLRPLRIAS